MVKLAEHGLKLNVCKCMIQTNVQTRLTSFISDGVEMPIIAAVGFPVLGTMLTLKGHSSAELEFRMGAA